MRKQYRWLNKASKKIEIGEREKTLSQEGSEKLVTHDDDIEAWVEKEPPTLDSLLGSRREKRSRGEKEQDGDDPIIQSPKSKVNSGKLETLGQYTLKRTKCYSQLPLGSPQSGDEFTQTTQPAPLHEANRGRQDSRNNSNRPAPGYNPFKQQRFTQSLQQDQLADLPIYDGKVAVLQNTPLENHSIIEILSREGCFLYVQPGHSYINGYVACWANAPSHNKVHLQPSENAQHKLRVLQNNKDRPMEGSTWVTGIFRKNDGTVIPVHIIKQPAIKEMFNLKDRHSKIKNKKVPGLGTLCLIIKCENENEKNVFIQEYAGYLGKMKFKEDDFPIIRFFYNDELTKTYNPQGILDLQRRIELPFVRVNLSKYTKLYMQEFTRYQKCIQGLQKGYGAGADLALMQAENHSFSSVLTSFRLEQVESFEKYILFHTVKLNSIMSLMQQELTQPQLELAVCVEFIQNTQQQIQAAKDCHASLLALTDEYRNYLYQMDNLLNEGRYNQNPETNSVDIEKQLGMNIGCLFKDFKINVDVYSKFQSMREFLAWTLEQRLMPAELNDGNLGTKTRVTKEWLEEVERAFDLQNQQQAINVM